MAGLVVLGRSTPWAAGVSMWGSNAWGVGPALRAQSRAVGAQLQMGQPEGSAGVGGSNTAPQVGGSSPFPPQQAHRQPCGDPTAPPHRFEATRFSPDGAAQRTAVPTAVLIAALTAASLISPQPPFVRSAGREEHPIMTAFAGEEMSTSLF